MKFTDIFKTHEKAGFIGSMVLFLFLLSGCFNPFRFVPLNQSGYFQKCREAEKVVSQAEQEYNNANQEIINDKKDKNTLQNFSEKRQKLQESQEQALRECNSESQYQFPKIALHIDPPNPRFQGRSQSSISNKHL